MKQCVLTGEKTILRPFTEQNITKDYLAWLNNKSLMRYSNQRFKEHSVASCKAYLESFVGTQNLFLAIYEKTYFVGTMTAYISDYHQVADMGIMVGDQAQGKGLGLDAWQTLMQYLITQNMRKITAGTLRCNLAMLRVIERSGMKGDGVRIKQELVEGQAVDVLYFAKF